jgi:hypothetical protein
LHFRERGFIEYLNGANGAITDKREACE